MIKRDGQKAFEMGWTSGYNRADAEWKERIEDIKSEIVEEFINNPQVHFYGDAEESTASACLEIINKYNK